MAEVLPGYRGGLKTGGSLPTRQLPSAPGDVIEPEQDISQQEQERAIDGVKEETSGQWDPLEQAKIVASEAMNIANIPQYLDQHLIRLIIDIERIDYIRSAITAVRRD